MVEGDRLSSLPGHPDGTMSGVKDHRENHQRSSGSATWENTGCDMSGLKPSKSSCMSYYELNQILGLCTTCVWNNLLRSPYELGC